MGMGGGLGAGDPLPLPRMAKDQVTLSRLAAIVENSPDAILVISPGGNVTDWNRGAERLYNYTAEEMVGQPVATLVPPELPGELENILETLRRGTVLGPYDTVRLRKDGSRVHVSLTACPITDVHGAVSGISWIARDITARKQAEDALRESAAQLTALYEHNPAGVMLSELASGRILRINTTFERLLGYTRDEVLGHSLRELGVVADSGSPLPGHSYSNREMTVHAKDGRAVFILASAQVLELGGKACVVNAAIDITARKAAEEAVRDANRRKDEFLAMLSHELRNPLAAIACAVHVMGEPGPRSSRAHQAAARQVRHMARLLDDLLDVARITHGTVALRRRDVALEDVVATAVDMVRPAAVAKGQALNVSLPPVPLHLHADPTRLVQVLANILDNAAKYTPPGGHILLSAERDGDTAVVRVRDDGIGIPADLLPHVFDLFAQGERAPARSEGGLGIGLTMVQRLVELHGGQVVARSDGPGTGSEFLVRLPVLPAPAQQPGAAAKDGGPPPRRRVLIVDDVPDAADVLAMVVDMEGHDARVAHGGTAALAMAAAFHPDVVLLDLGMPGMDGYETARHLRAQPGGDKVSLIAVTGYGQDEDRERTRAAGFNHHLVKPVDVAALQQMIAQAPPVPVP